MCHSVEQSNNRLITVPACPAHALAHLLGTKSYRCPSLDEQFGYLKMAAVEGIMQGGDAITTLAAWVIYCCSVVQEEADDLWGQDHMASVPRTILSCLLTHTSTMCPA